MRSIWSLLNHAIVALEVAFHGGQPLPMLSALCAAILAAALLRLPPSPTPSSIRETLMLWASAWGTVLLWVGCVLLLHAYGLA